MRLQGKVAVVTGGGSGIGQQVVLELLRRGARVAAADLRPEGLEETRGLAQAGAALSTHVVDVTDRAAVQALPDAVLQAHGAVDVVLNVAGIIQPFVRVIDLDYDAIDRVLAVNLYGTLHVVKAFLPHLVQRPEAWLANVSSMGGFVPVPGQALYGASKAAVKLLTEALYAELMESPVGVSVIMPGAVATNIGRNSGVEPPPRDDGEEDEESSIRALPADEAARIILDGIEHERLYILVGRDARMMYLGSRLAPKQATRMIQRQMKELLDDEAA